MRTVGITLGGKYTVYFANRSEYPVYMGARLDGDMLFLQLPLDKGGLEANMHSHVLSKDRDSNGGYFQVSPKTEDYKRFGRTQFEMLKIDERTWVVDLKKPLGGHYAPPRKESGKRVHKKKEEKSNVLAASKEDIRSAVALLNSLNREEYRVLLDTNTNAISVRREEIFE